MWTMRVGLIILGAAAVAGLILLATYPGSKPGELPGTARAPIVVAEGTDLPDIAASPGPIRIVVTAESAADNPGKGTRGQVHVTGHESPVFEGKHLGPLTGQDFERLRDSVILYRTTKEKALHTFKVETGTSKELLEEASLLRAAEQAKAAERALLAGSYMVTNQGEGAPLSLPGAEVLGTGAMKGGAQVNVTIIMPFAQFPELREIVAYRKEIRRFHESERARKFNSLPYEERAKIVARVDALRSQKQLSQSDRKYIREVFGYEHQLNRTALILYLPDAARR